MKKIFYWLLCTLLIIFIFFFFFGVLPTLSDYLNTQPKVILVGIISGTGLSMLTIGIYKLFYEGLVEIMELCFGLAFTLGGLVYLFSQIPEWMVLIVSVLPASVMTALYLLLRERK